MEGRKINHPKANLKIKKFVFQDDIENKNDWKN